MKKFSFLFILIALITQSALAQRSSRYEYGKEFIWGVNKNTTGGLIGGFVFRTSRQLSEGKYESIGVEFMNVKHQKEYRWSSARTGSFFIYGKTNYLFSIRTQYGREFIVFDKAPDQGVEVKLNLAAGPSFGLLTPYYVETCAQGCDISSPSLYDKYNSTIDYYNIKGPGKLLQGLDESKIKIGLNLKASMSFELGTIKSQVTGFEVGTLLEAYAANDIQLMINTEPRSVYPIAFITLFYGTRK